MSLKNIHQKASQCTWITGMVYIMKLWPIFQNCQWLRLLFYIQTELNGQQICMEYVQINAHQNRLIVGLVQCSENHFPVW